jgi:molybdopterin molybdotransferase
MTGGMVPVGADRVVQQEDCFCTGKTLEVPEKTLNLQPRFIQRMGSFIPQASPVIPRGTLLGAREIGLLATTGNQFLEVFRRVSVSFFCNGNELVSIDDAVPSGKKISSNRYLLGALLSSRLAVPEDCGVAQDSPAKIRELLGAISRSKTDLIISTGGMGPGKYDLLEAVFEKAGGEIIYRSVALRPGQSSLFGILAGKLYFGLPGPPFAVGVLFNELVLPALRKMQGHLAYRNRDWSALLEHDISSEKNRVFTVREGVLFFRGCTRYVRLAKGREQPDCLILLEEGKPCYLQGEEVRIHMIAQ